jgi:transcriptional regulator with XRE-family HTH domain
VAPVSTLEASPGTLLREWRRRRRLSQLDLALESGVSARHLSFLETGRSRPSREMVLHLSEQLDVPLRDRNQLLLAAGFAPAYAERAIDAPEMAPVREALDRILKGHEPYPAVVVDRWWDLAGVNAGVALLTARVAPHLLEPPANALRVTLHPEGMAPHIRNLAEWRAHLLDRLRREVAVTGDDRLAALERELSAYPGGEAPLPPNEPGIAVPLRLAADGVELSFFSTISTFGTAIDITLAELSIEAFFPADERTGNYIREMMPASSARAGSPSVSKRTA